MSRKREDRGRLPPFIPLLKDTLASPAWRAMSHGARSPIRGAKGALYSSNFKNNGKIYVPQRDAAKELGSGFEEITRLVPRAAALRFHRDDRGGVPGRRREGQGAALEVDRTGYMRDPPTRDFVRWNGTKFKRPRRAGRDGKQNPTTERRSAPLRKGGAPLLRKGGAPTAESATQRRRIQGASTATERRCITSITTTKPAGAAPRYAVTPWLHGGAFWHRRAPLRVECWSKRG